MSDHTFGDRSTSDIVVRLRTKDGRDHWFLCHRVIITQHCRYFAERLSDGCPTLQIIDSRNCVDVFCDESDLDHYINFLRLLYNTSSSGNSSYGVKGTLGILQVAILLGGERIIHNCIEYLEAVPWEESEEEAILKVIPKLGTRAEPILARLQSVDPTTIQKVFIVALNLATAFLPSSMDQPKAVAQEQLEYMVTEDNDPPLLTIDEHIKNECNHCLDNMFSRLQEDMPKTSLHPLEEETETRLISTLSDLAWICNILPKFDLMKHFIETWMDASKRVFMGVELMKGSETGVLEIKSKVIEVVAKVLETVGYGMVPLPADKRFHLVRTCLPFVKKTKFELEGGEKGESSFRMRDDLCDTIESALVSLVLALPSAEQADVLTIWLSTKDAKFPDLSEAFEVWCYRSKTAKRKLSLAYDCATDSGG